MILSLFSITYRSGTRRSEAECDGVNLLWPTPCHSVGTRSDIILYINVLEVYSVYSGLLRLSDCRQVPHFSAVKERTECSF